MTPSTGTPSTLILNLSFSEHKPCGDLRPQLSGALAEPRPFTTCLWVQFQQKHDSEGQVCSVDLRLKQFAVIGSGVETACGG